MLNCFIRGNFLQRPLNLEFESGAKDIYVVLLIVTPSKPLILDRVNPQPLQEWIGTTREADESENDHHNVISRYIVVM